MQRFVAVIVCIICMMNLCACKNNYIHNCVPANQENTYWVCEEEDISFYVHSFSRVLGKINVGEEQLEVQFWWGFMGLSNLQVYSLDIFSDTTEPYEHEDDYYLWETWECTFLGKDKFVAKVKETTYFEEGQKFTFYKTPVGDNEIVYPPNDNYGSAFADPPEITTVEKEACVKVKDREFSFKEINDMIVDSFNSVLFYSGYYKESDLIHLNSDLILGKNIEYSLYYTNYYSLVEKGINTVITMVITNLPCTSDENKFCFYQFAVTEDGMSSVMYSNGSVHKNDEYMKKADFKVSGSESKYLGDYSVCLTEIKVPEYKERSEEWCKHAEKALADAIAKAIPENFTDGTYKVYVRNFNIADERTEIVVASYDGTIYRGVIKEPESAFAYGKISIDNIYDCELVENGKLSSGTLAVIEKVKQNSVLRLDYTIKDGKIVIEE